MATTLSNWHHWILNSCLQCVQQVWPQHCLLCAARAGDALVCGACYEQLPWLTRSRCPQCALPTHDGATCGACLGDPPRFDAVSAVFAYAWPLAPLIHHYKYAGNLALAAFFGRGLASTVTADSVDLLIPMPLSQARLRERGFNQALELARVVSRITGIRLAADACRRVRDSAPQASLPWRERRKNIRGAFVCDADLTGQRVAVIDDVMTTGSTLDELARNLRQAGAAEIQGWMVARTLQQDGG
jgi:ComF family protein